MKGKSFKAKARKPVLTMNRTEQAFYDSCIKGNPRVRSSKYERIKFVLAAGSTWLPDFYIIDTDGNIIIIEIKGRWRADDRIQIKVVSELFPEFHIFGVRMTTKKIVKLEGFSGSDPKEFEWLFQSMLH